MLRSLPKSLPSITGLSKHIHKMLQVFIPAKQEPTYDIRLKANIPVKFLESKLTAHWLKTCRHTDLFKVRLETNATA